MANKYDEDRVIMGVVRGPISNLIYNEALIHELNNVNFMSRI